MVATTAVSRRCIGRWSRLSASRAFFPLTLDEKGERRAERSSLSLSRRRWLQPPRSCTESSNWECQGTATPVLVPTNDANGSSAAFPSSRPRGGDSCIDASVGGPASRPRELFSPLLSLKRAGAEPRDLSSRPRGGDGCNHRGLSPMHRSVVPPLGVESIFSPYSR